MQLIALMMMLLLCVLWLMGTAEAVPVIPASPTIAPHAYTPVVFAIAEPVPHTNIPIVTVPASFIGIDDQKDGNSKEKLSDAKILMLTGIPKPPELPPVDPSVLKTLEEIRSEHYNPEKYTYSEHETPEQKKVGSEPEKYKDLSETDSSTLSQEFKPEKPAKQFNIDPEKPVNNTLENSKTYQPKPFLSNIVSSLPSLPSFIPSLPNKFPSLNLPSMPTLSLPSNIPSINIPFQMPSIFNRPQMRYIYVYPYASDETL